MLLCMLKWFEYDGFVSCMLFVEVLLCVEYVLIDFGCLFLMLM